jgi:thiol-disulfide isomerase/thioredoxin
MRRLLLAETLGLALGILTACSATHAPSYDPNKTLSVASPDLVAIKKTSDIPNCPKLTAGSVSGGMPAVTLGCLGGGRPVDLAGLRGPMIVNFWASWCGACRQEMPALATYAKAQSAVQVIGIDFLDAQPGAPLDLAKRSGVAYPLVADPKGSLDKASPLPHIPGLPLTVFLDAQGTIAHVEAGAYDTQDEVAAAAQKYLGTGG